MQATVERDVSDDGGCEAVAGRLRGAEATSFARSSSRRLRSVPARAADRCARDRIGPAGRRRTFHVDRTVAAAKALELRLHASFLDSESPFDVTFVISSIRELQRSRWPEAARRALPHLHVTPARGQGLTMESREAQRTDPAAAAGTLTPTRRLKLAPAAAYNASDGFQAGGTVSVRNIADRIDTLDAQAIASKRSHLFRLAMVGSPRPHLSGSTPATGVSIADQQEAGSPGDQFSTNALKAQFAAQTRPFEAALRCSFWRKPRRRAPGGGRRVNGAPVDDRTGYGAPALPRDRNRRIATPPRDRTACCSDMFPATLR
jgi:hypothetical protein